MIWTKKSGAGRPRVRIMGLRKAVALVVAASTVGLMSGCTSTPSGESTASKTLTIALGGDPGTLDWTTLGSGGQTLLLLQTAWDSLLKQEPDGTVVPNAAESYDVSKDLKTYTFHLRSGMKFSDGTPVTAAASKASIEHMRDAGANESVMLAGATVTAPDDLTVVVKMAKPDKLLPEFMAIAPGIIANPTSLANKDAGPQGSGPYVLDKANTTTGSTYTFERNQYYWNDDAYPYDKIVYKVFTDQTAALSALRTGQVNATFVAPQSVSQVENSNFNLSQVQIDWAGLHIFDRTGKIVPALGDVRVRQAINMVFDRQAIIKALYLGKAVESNQIFNPTSNNPGYDASLSDKYPYDVDAAKKLMAAAGYADGFSFDLPKVSGFDTANSMIIQQLSLLNIKANEVDVPLTQFGDILQGKYPIFYFTLGSTNSAGRVVADALTPTSIWNPLKTQTPELDALLAKASTATGDDATKAYQAINKYVVDQAWFAPWAYITDTWATTADTKATPCVGNQTPYLSAFRPA